MSQTLTFYPLGNAETCLLELGNGAKLLFDYAAMYDGSTTDARYDIEKELSTIRPCLKNKSCTKGQDMSN